jgi:hypothetical protein
MVVILEVSMVGSKEIGARFLGDLEEVAVDSKVEVAVVLETESKEISQGRTIWCRREDKMRNPILARRMTRLMLKLL